MGGPESLEKALCCAKAKMGDPMRDKTTTKLCQDLGGLAPWAGLGGWESLIE